MLSNRWIRIPLIVTVNWLVTFSLFDLFLGPVHFWMNMITGLLLGFFLEGYAWFRVRRKFGKVTPAALEPRQDRTLTLMQGKTRALETCRQAVEYLQNLKLRGVDFEKSRIEAKVRMNWHAFGDKISIELHHVTNDLTEVNIACRPMLPTVIVDSGEAWNSIEQLVSEIRRLDFQPSTQMLANGAEILTSATTGPLSIVG